jgi:hypothetical protein
MLAAAIISSSYKYIKQILLSGDSSAISLWFYSRNGYSLVSSVSPTTAGSGITLNSAKTDYISSGSFSPYLEARPISASFQIGSAYTSAATTPTSSPVDTKFSPDGSAFFYVQLASTPIYSAYTFSSGFGTRYAAPASFLSSPNNGSWHPTGNALGFANGSSSTGASATYAWTYAGGWGSQYTAPASFTGITAPRVSFSPLGNVVAYSSKAAPVVTVYPFTTASGFGTKYSAPATDGPINTQTIFWNPAGTVVAGIGSTSPYIWAYPFTYASGFGTKYTDPVTAWTIQSNSSPGSFDATGLLISGAGSTAAGNWQVYDWTDSDGFGVKVASGSSGVPDQRDQNYALV